MRAPEQDPTPDCPQSGASRLWRSLPPDGYRSGSGLFADIGLDAHWPGDIGSLCRHWPLCPLAWGPRPAPGHDRAWFHPRCSPGLDALRRKSTRPLWDTWLEVTRMLPPTAAPSTGRRLDTRVTRIRDGPTLAHIGPCAHWPGDPGPLPDMTVPGFTHGAVRASTLFDGSQHAHFGTHG